MTLTVYDNVMDNLAVNGKYLGDSGFIQECLDNLGKRENKYDTMLEIKCFGWL